MTDIIKDGLKFKGIRIHGCKSAPKNHFHLIDIGSRCPYCGQSLIIIGVAMDLREIFKEELERDGHRYPVEVMEILDIYDRSVVKLDTTTKKVELCSYCDYPIGSHATSCLYNTK